MTVRHSCDNKPCFNPDHLIVGTPKENTRDKIERSFDGRGATNGNAKLTAEQVAEIRASSEKQVVLASRYGVGQSQIGRIKRGEQW